MTFHFYSPLHFEEWDWTAADRGIGGSETHHIEMATRLAKRGHEVISYSPMPGGVAQVGPANVQWKPLESADFSAPGIWVLYRCPEVIERFHIRCPDCGLRHRRPDPLPNSSPRVFAFDWGGTLESHPSLQRLAREAREAGHQVHLVPALGTVPQSDEEILALYRGHLDRLGLYDVPIHRVPDDGGDVPTWKTEVLTRLHADQFWDDRADTVAAANAAGIQAFHVTAIVNDRAPDEFATHSQHNPYLSNCTACGQGIQQELWLVMQDEGYRWTAQAQAQVDVCFAFCASHEAATLKRYPGLAHAMTRTSNGLKMDLIRRVEAEGVPERNPHRVMYASSPDRGLKTLLELWPRVREHVPDAELHCFYGFNNIDKLLDQDQPWARRFRQEKADLERLMQQPGVTWHGRVSQADLYREWLKTGVWWYPTQFTETSCITCMEAQALGAVPVTAPIWALRDNVQHGIFVEGEAYRDPLTRARHVAEVVRLLSVPAMQDSIRTSMMQGARQRFNWERYVDQFEALADGRSGFQFVQFGFQHKHARGRILNVGCDTDPSDFAARGAVNVDINEVSPGSGRPNPIQVKADARNLPFVNEADTVILGDILEHMGDADILRCLQSAKRALRPGGRVVVTIPDDHRPPDEQHTMGMAPPPEYTRGSSCYHLRPIPTAHIVALVREAGLRPTVVQEIDYTHFLGTGIVAEAA